MKHFTTLLLGLLLTLVGGIEYKAAVVEYSPDQNTTDFIKRIQNNLNGFKKALETIKNQNVQIIVFPEDGISGLAGVSLKDLDDYFEDIPEVSDDNAVNPCLQSLYSNRPILQTLSCLSRDYKLVLVANMGDKQLCNRTTDANCPSTGMYFYNTDVVFENDGRLIAKYHKIHLYSAERVFFAAGNQTSGISFRTNFGVTFGIFTCYDILFGTPAACLLDSDIKNFIFPTAWGNSFPYYMSTVVQQGWSYRNKANLLAANLHVSLSLEEFYGTGSGLYSAGFAKEYYLTGNSMEATTSKVLVAVLPDNPANLDDTKQEGMVINPTAIEAKIKSATYKILEVSSNIASVSTTYKGEELKCTLSYKLTPNETYALGAYMGIEGRFGDFTYAVCYVLHCSSQSTCGHVTSQSGTIFQAFELSGVFPTNSRVYPSGFSSGYKLLSPDIFQHKNNWTTLSVASPTNILSAGLWSMVGEPMSVCIH